MFTWCCGCPWCPKLWLSPYQMLMTGAAFGPAITAEAGWRKPKMVVSMRINASDFRCNGFILEVPFLVEGCRLKVISQQPFFVAATVFCCRNRFFLLPQPFFFVAAT